MLLQKEPLRQRRMKVEGRPSKERIKDLRLKYKQENKGALTKQLLTKLKLELETKTNDEFVLNKARRILDLYANAKNIEYLPNGMPYVVVNDPLICNAIGYNIALKYPVILVSHYLSKEERQSVALHEYVEWLGYKDDGFKAQKAHNVALKVQSLELIKNIEQKRLTYLKTERKRVKEEYTDNLKKHKSELLVAFNKAIKSIYSTHVFRFGNYSYDIFYDKAKQEFNIHIWNGFLQENLIFKKNVSLSDEDSTFIARYSAKTFEILP